jgi:tetratricopeptide (TPR) repeat protein
MNTNDQLNADVVVRRTVSLIDNGRIYSLLGQPAKALACFEKAVEICRPLSSQSDAVALSLTQALDNKANALVDLGRVAESVPIYEEAIQILENNQRGDGEPWEVREIAISVMNKGRAFMLLGQHDEAAECFQRAIADFWNCGTCEDWALGLVNYGDLCFRQGNFKAAAVVFSESVAAWKTVVANGFEEWKAEYSYSLFSLADVLFHLGCYRKALGLAEQAAVIQSDIVNYTNAAQDRNDLHAILKLRGDILTKLGGGGGRVSEVGRDC